MYVCTATLRMTFKNQRKAYFSLRAVTTQANAHQDVSGYWTKLHQICSRGNFFHRRSYWCPDPSTVVE